MESRWPRRPFTGTICSRSSMSSDRGTAHDPSVYIAGNMLMYYVPNDKRRHVSPDVYLVKGIPPRYRGAYFVWIEGKGPNIVFEISSARPARRISTKSFGLYQDQSDTVRPDGEYLRPSLQGFRLREGMYVPIDPVEGPLPSEELGLHMERDGLPSALRPGNRPALLTARPWSQTRQGRAAKQQAEAAKQQAEAAKRRPRCGRARSTVFGSQARSPRRPVSRGEARKTQGELEKLAGGRVDHEPRTPRSSTGHRSVFSRHCQRSASATSCIRPALAAEFSPEPRPVQARRIPDFHDELGPCTESTVDPAGRREAGAQTESRIAIAKRIGKNGESRGPKRRSTPCSDRS